MNESPAEYKKKLIETYAKHSNIRFLCISAKNISLARNVAVFYAKNKYVVLLDSDCHIPRNYIQQARQYINKADIIVGRVIFENNSSKLTTQYHILRSLWYKSPKRLYSPNLIIRKAIYDLNGLYNPKLSGCEDSEWSERVMRDPSNIVIERVDSITMYHQPDNVPKLYKTWIRYGRLRAYLTRFDIHINKVSKKQILQKYLNKHEGYKLSRGVTFFFILYAYRFFRLLGSLHELWLLRKTSSSYFAETNQYLKSEEFKEYNKQLVVPCQTHTNITRSTSYQDLQSTMSKHARL